MIQNPPATENPSPGEQASLPIREALQVLRSNWKLILASALVGILLAATWALLQPRTYQASTTAVVTAGSSENLGVALTADNLAKSKAVQYEQLATSSSVAKKAVEESGLDITPARALSSVTVTVPRDTAQMQVEVVAPTPDAATALSNAWVKGLADEVDRIENGGTSVDNEGSSRRVDNGENRHEPGSSIIKVQQLIEATKPTSPHSPNVQMALLIGLAAGLALGLALAALRTLLDRRIKSAASLQERVKAPVLASVPLVQQSKKSSNDDGATRALLAHDEAEAGEVGSKERRERFRIAESFKELRTNLQFMNPDNPPRVIVVSSSVPGEGKSTVSTNLALTLAQSNIPTVLIDADLRRPVVARAFGLVNTVGLTNVVVGNAYPEDVLQEVPGHPALRVLAGGSVPPNPSEILASSRFDQLVQGLAQDSMVIIDAPPLLPVTDAAILAARYDGCILVVKAGSTNVDAISKAADNLKKVHAKLLGTVLNQIPTKGSQASYYQYYGGYYGDIYTYESHADDAVPSGEQKKKKKRRRRTSTT